MGHFSAEMDSYLEGSIAHLLGLSCSEEQPQRDLHSQVFYLQRRLQETQDKYQKAKEEASLSAQALRRQIAETQQLNEFCSLVTEECHRLEEGVCDDAEERAVDAENRASEAETSPFVTIRTSESAKMYEEEKGHLRDEVVVHSMVSSAVTSAVCKAVEQEKEEELNAVKLKDAENNLKILGAEVQVLFEENQTWNRLFKVKLEALDGQSVSPLHIQGENVSPILPRQPLTPLRSNFSERKTIHR
ncbi:hypothetical protein O6H91_Y554200 [Diphasiastrum complanatum]|nr:hypothetical protein O6H91_Y554200 [Diphasiastrum complanatum]